MKNRWIIVIGLFLLTFQGMAQIPENRTGQLADISMKDGTRVIGKLEQVTPDTVILFTAYFGDLTLLQSQIKVVRYLSEPDTDIPAGYTFVNPNASRHFFSPTAIPLKKHEGYYQNFYVAFNMVNWGFTNNLSIGVAAVPFTWFMEDGMNIALTGKLGFEVADNWYLSGGFIGGFLSNVAYGGIGFGLITYGTEDNNVTLGGGYAGLAVDPGSEYEEQHETIVYNAAGMLRLSDHFALVTENWYFAVPDFLLLSYGGRYMGDKVTVDVGFVNNGDLVKILPIGIPLLGVVIYL
ncbi:MAG TPA: hypothetical protein PKX04_09515 [Chitinophagales bacterium]|nr:hypothetical protein [Bacteroidota bacterium]HPE98185.1 hypothetical protein [Chitinophagales bacterium]HPR28326.1 hypothetical protein [Chitinophagales bacterium]HQU76300.1 hypothetical protein [Chitinophagales bacterium]HRX24327.1 hypothetical protein [Chitinophagales bacterium]